MAEVTNESQLREWIDDYLAYLIGEWETMPEMAAEWDAWEDHEQLDFVVEWPIREDRLHQLRQWAAQGLLTPAQRECYDQRLYLAYSADRGTVISAYQASSLQEVKIPGDARWLK